MALDLESSSTKLLENLRETMERLRQADIHSEWLEYRAEQIVERPFKNALITNLSASSLATFDEPEAGRCFEMSDPDVKDRVTNCKNCAAPLQSPKCEYCGTNYAIDFSPVKIEKKHLPKQSTFEDFNLRLSQKPFERYKARAEFIASLRALEKQQQMRREREKAFTWQSFFGRIFHEIVRIYPSF